MVSSEMVSCMVSSEIVSCSSNAWFPFKKARTMHGFFVDRPATIEKPSAEFPSYPLMFGSTCWFVDEYHKSG